MRSVLSLEALGERVDSESGFSVILNVADIGDDALEKQIASSASQADPKPCVVALGFHTRSSVRRTVPLRFAPERSACRKFRASLGLCRDHVGIM